MKLYHSPDPIFRMKPKKLKQEQKREHSKRKGFRFTSYMKEDHKEPIFGVSFNPYTNPLHPPVFATVGSNRWGLLL